MPRNSYKNVQGYHYLTNPILEAPLNPLFFWGKVYLTPALSNNFPTPIRPTPTIFCRHSPFHHHQIIVHPLFPSPPSNPNDCLRPPTHLAPEILDLFTSSLCLCLSSPSSSLFRFSILIFPLKAICCAMAALLSLF